MILVKTIKPGRFKGDPMNRILRNQLRKVGNTIIREDYGAITKNWEEENKPKIKLHTHLTARTPSPSIEIEVTGRVWNYVEEGTKPHAIFAGIYTGKSKKKSLAFPSMFSPKTTPGVIGSKAGKRGGTTVFTPFVWHPGTEPRHFHKAIVKKRRPWFKRQMEDAMREAVRASGHGPS